MLRMFMFLCTRPKSPLSQDDRSVPPVKVQSFEEVREPGSPVAGGGRWIFTSGYLECLRGVELESQER